MRPIRYGVFGAGRGQFFMKPFLWELGFQLRAVCDRNEARLREVLRQYPGTAVYTDFDDFLAADMDVVILCNYFDEHAPYAIRAMRNGKHVISETLPAVHMDELAELVRTVRQTGKIYMLAEDYPYIAYNQEMARIYRSGEIGEALYAYAQYNNTISPEDMARISNPDHWKNRLAPAYYLTHALAPLLRITGLRPVTVSAVSIAAGRGDLLRGTAAAGDPGFSMRLQMENGAIFCVMGLNLPGHCIWYNIHGTRGAMENERTTGAEYPESYWGSGCVRIWHDAHNCGAFPKERRYAPAFAEYPELAAQSDQGGGELYVMLDFRRAFLEGKQPEMDIVRAASLAAAGILGWRSCLENGRQIALPDFTNLESLEQFAGDCRSPFSKDPAFRLSASTREN